MIVGNRRQIELGLLRQARCELVEIDRITAEIGRIKHELATMPDVGNDGVGTSTLYMKNSSVKASLESSFREEFYKRQQKTLDSVTFILRMLPLAFAALGVVYAVLNTHNLRETLVAVVIAVIGGLLCALIPCDLVNDRLILRGFGLYIGLGLSHAFGKIQFENILYVCIMGVLVGLRIVIPLIISRRKFVISDKQMRQLDKAAKQDEQNARDQAAAKARQATEAANRRKAARERMQPALDRLYDQLETHQLQLEALDIVGPDERNITDVDALIKILESHRADSIPEALRIYDEQKYRRGLIARDQFERSMQMLEQKWQRDEQFQRDMDAAAHRSRMEKLAQDQLDELERQRRDDEYYRRYGKPL